jgi:hypothetical protein
VGLQVVASGDQWACKPISMSVSLAVKQSQGLVGLRNKGVHLVVVGGLLHAI